MQIDVYTDGSSDGTSEGPGGWAYVILVNGVKIIECSGHAPKATNNIMELAAAINGLERVLDFVKPRDVVTLVSDSMLVLNYSSGKWNCKTPHLLPQYLSLRKLHDKLNLNKKWVKGHSGDPFNERCDELATTAKVNP